jgi:hypothetical protein
MILYQQLDRGAVSATAGEVCQESEVLEQIQYQEIRKSLFVQTELSNCS